MSQHSRAKKSNVEKEKSIMDKQKLYRDVFGSASGQKVLEDLKLSLHFGKTLFFEGQPNTDLHFHLGRQSVINNLVEFLSSGNK